MYQVIATPERVASEVDTTMRGVWMEAGTLELREDLVRPRATPDEASVRVIEAGICSTDLGLLRGLYGFSGVPGHEFVGVVEQGPDSLVGRRVVGEINIACHDCVQCNAGRTKHCIRRTALGIRGHPGAFAETLTVPLENLHVVPDVVTDDQAVFIEPLAAALDVFDHVDVDENDRVLVIGPGKLGQLVCRVLANRCYDVHALGRSPSKLRRLPPSVRPIVARTDLVTGYDLVVECSGSPEGLETAIRAVRARGTIVLKSTTTTGPHVDTTAIVVNEIRLFGSRCGSFPRAIDALRDGDVTVTELIDERYELADAPLAFEHAQRPGVLKVLLHVAGPDRPTTAPRKTPDAESGTGG